MASHKRRRSINIDIAYIDSLRFMAKSIGGVTATSLASKIFIGTSQALQVVGRSNKSKAISMTEAMWLSIRSRAQTKDRTIGHVAHGLLNGEESPLTSQEVSFGCDRAREREERRARGVPEEPQKPIKRTVKKEVEKHFGCFIGSMASWSPRPPKGSVKGTAEVKSAENDKSSTARKKEVLNIVVPTIKDDEKKSQHKLSVGRPLSVKDKNENVAKEAEPDEETYGGYFQF
jgi:hypothetical protein